MIISLISIITLGLLWLLYHYLPNKKIFAYFCFTLAAAGLIVYFTWPHNEPKTENVMTTEERYERQQQQQIFSDWYKNYQRDIAELDRNWQWYHQILENFKEDNISIQTAYVRLKQLDEDSKQLKERIASNAPPIALNSGCYDLLIEVMKKTNAYADAEYKTIALTRAAADPANMPASEQAEQSKILQSVMIRESPVGLYTAKEIITIREYLSLPPEEPASQP